MSTESIRYNNSFSQLPAQGREVDSDLVNPVPTELCCHWVFTFEGWHRNSEFRSNIQTRQGKSSFHAPET